MARMGKEVQRDVRSKITKEKTMKVTLHLEGTRQEILAQIAEFSLVLETSLAAQKPAAEKKAAKPKKEAPAEEPAEEIEDDFGMGDDEPAEEEIEEEEETSGPTLTEVTDALKKVAAKGKEFKAKAIAILKKYKVSNVDEIPKGKLAEVMKLVKAIK